MDYKHKYMKYKVKYINELKKKEKDKDINLESQPINRNISVCNGKRDGKSGCRTCCRINFVDSKDDYGKCVSLCMSI